MLQRLRRWWQEYYAEWSQKVEWPSFDQLFTATITVLVAMLLVAMVIGLIDLGFSSIMRFLYSLFA